MLKRKSALMACGATILGFSIATSAAGNARMLGTRNFLTFSGPVALPGVTLGAGTYAFEVLDSESGGGVVRVLEKLPEARRHRFAHGFPTVECSDTSSSMIGARRRTEPGVLVKDARVLYFHYIPMHMDV